MPNQKAPNKTAPEAPEDKTQPPALKGDAKSDGAKKWDVIDEASWESFPGSDAPSHWAGRDVSPEEQEAKAKETKKEE